jgi:hypothetical protein
VAITGHRPNRLHIGAGAVGRRLEAVLQSIRAASDGRQWTAISALAEGSDRLFAHAALRLGYRLGVILPFESADYMQTFADRSQDADYLGLLAAARARIELPGSLADAEAAYEAVGHATVEACDVLIAVWDGKGAAGRGGTPEIIAYALEQRRPVIWIDAARDRLPRLITAPRAGGDRHVSMTALASRASPLRRRDIRKLATAILCGGSSG